MIILGFDPGVAIVGYGIIQKKGSTLHPLQYGCINTSQKIENALRLKQIYEGAKEIIRIYKPDMVSVEKLYFNKNVTTAMNVGQARGVLMLAAVEQGLDLYEYTPLQIKQALVGYGRAEKKQIQDMVKMILCLKEIPKPDDAADALAIAICHANSVKMTDIIKGNIT